MTLKKEIIMVEDMICNHCKQAVEKAALAVPGVVAAQVDLSAKSLQVEYDESKTGGAAIRAAVEDAGFTAG